MTMLPQPEPGIFNPIRIDEAACICCNLCDWVCPGDIIYKEEDNKETLPVVSYPDECWFCGLCESTCPTQAIEIVFPDEMIKCGENVMTLLGKTE